MSTAKRSSIIRRGVAFARRDLRETLGTNPLIMLAGVAVIIVLLVVMVVATLLADRAAENRRDQLANDVEPFAFALDDLEVQLLSVAIDTRGYVFTGDQMFLDRYERNVVMLSEALEEIDQTADSAGLEETVGRVEGPIVDYMASAETSVAAAQRGDDEVAIRSVGEDGTLALDQSAAAFDQAHADVSGEMTRLRASIEDVDRFERLVLLVAGPLAVLAAAVLIWLAIVNHRLLNAARTEEARFGSMNASLTRHGICQVDWAGRVEYVNQAAANTLGFEEDDLLGKSLHDLTHYRRPDGSPLPRSECKLAEVAAAGDRYTGDEWFVRKDGSMMPVTVTSEPMAVRGRLVGTVIVFQDITERLEQERMREKFLSFASHELRTPMMILSGYAQRLQRRLRRDPSLFDDDIRAAIADLSEGAARMKTITEVVLDLTKVQSGQPLAVKIEKVDLRALLEQHTTALRSNYPQVRVESSYADRTLVVESDKARIAQVLANLLDNAAKYAGDDPVVEIAAGSKNGDAFVRVKDNGPGIPAEERSQVFQQFYRGASTGDKSGLGVGLFITKHIVDRMGGTLTFSSENGDGTEFTLTVPLVEHSG